MNDPVKSVQSEMNREFFTRMTGRCPSCGSCDIVTGKRKVDNKGSADHGAARYMEWDEETAVCGSCGEVLYSNNRTLERAFGRKKGGPTE